MLFEIKVHENGQITLKKDKQVIILSRDMSRVLSIIEDIHKNNNESTYIKRKEPGLASLLNL